MRLLQTTHQGTLFVYQEGSLRFNLTFLLIKKVHSYVFSILIRFMSVKF